METTRYCAFNKSRGIFLSLDVSVLDAALEPLKVLKVLIEGPGAEARSGLWLQRFKAVPVAQALSPFDLIYLDKNHTVVHAVALTVDGEFLPFVGDPTSALILPSGTIALSETRPGDLLIVVSAPQAGIGTAGATASSATPRPSAPSGIPPFPMPSHGAPPSASIPSPAFSSEGGAPSPLDRFLIAQSGPVAGPVVAPPTRKVAAWTEDTLRAPARPASEPAAAHFTPYSRLATPAESHSVVELPEPIPAFALPEDELAPVMEEPGIPQVEYYYEAEPTMTDRLLRWLYPQKAIANERRRRDRRDAYRLHRPGLIAYFFTGGAPRPHPIRDISVTGFYMQTDQLWMPGTVIRMTLQRTGTSGRNPGDSLTVHSRMVRHGAAGGGFEFVLSGFLD